MMFGVSDNIFTYERSSYTLNECLIKIGGAISLVMWVGSATMTWYTDLLMKLDLIQSLFFIRNKTNSLKLVRKKTMLSKRIDR